MLKKIFHRERKITPEVEKLIFEKYYNRVYHTAYFIVKDPDLAQDILQESFMKAFRNIERVHEIEKIGAWLATITTRTAIDHLRKMKRWNDYAVDDVLLTKELLNAEIDQISVVEIAAEKKLIKKVMWEEIDKLTPAHKEVLYLYYYEDLTYEEISVLLDVKLATVKTRVHRAKLKLKEALEQQTELMEVVLDVKS
ncbi:RNA polymerase sigma factor [Sporosarcina sp. Sa2YVA2]|uniref:RNA polymerase sigma factor n=1 Tax=Sporosarcina quadrami TaxID=2762234 RepID=A0ABR8UBS7_9BACL|nr:RNA polymerase sigma factor [Sporosarcina quadrami]MBD7985456.1 RNA polymerase sigma factor [Sporosarcina quadrami]